MSKTEVAKYLGITSAAVGNYESGIREPSFETLDALADLFNVNVDYLLDRTDYTTSILKGSPKEIIKIRKINELLKELTLDGLDKIIERAEDLLETPKYKKDPGQIE